MIRPILKIQLVTVLQTSQQSVTESNRKRRKTELEDIRLDASTLPQNANSDK